MSDVEQPQEEPPPPQQQQQQQTQPQPPSNGATAATSTTEPPRRVLLPTTAPTELNGQEWLDMWRRQEAYVAYLERKSVQQEGELVEYKQTENRLRGQLCESQLREKVLVRRLTAKEHETQDYVCQLNELKSCQSASASSLRAALLDPAVNCLLQQLRAELQATRLKLEDTQNELAAWKFTPDSNTGKRLMAKCRLLYQENEELGKMSSSGRVAKLESDLALQRSFSEEVRQSQNELDSFIADLDEDVEGMQSTVLYLQQELKRAKEQTQQLLKENATLKTTASTVKTEVKEEEDSLLEDEESSSVDQRTAKRVRRSSVLSIDYNDELVTNGDAAMMIPSDTE